MKHFRLGVHLPALRAIRYNVCIALGVLALSSVAEAQRGSSPPVLPPIVQEMLNAYNNGVSSDTSLGQFLGAPAATHNDCAISLNAAYKALYDRWVSGYVALKKKGDNNAASDAMTPQLMQTYRTASQHYLTCMQRPLHTIPTPTTGSGIH
jgi:hypothetical protein